MIDIPAVKEKGTCTKLVKRRSEGIGDKDSALGLRHRREIINPIAGRTLRQYDSPDGFQIHDGQRRQAKEKHHEPSNHYGSVSPEMMKRNLSRLH